MGNKPSHGAVILTQQRVLELTERYSYILLEWLWGSSQLELGKKYCPSDSESVGENAINRIIRMNCPRNIKHHHIKEVHEIMYAEGKGLGGLTEEAMAEHGKKLAEANGFRPYDENKVVDTGNGRYTLPEFVVYLKSRNMPWKDITRLVNTLYHEDRTPQQLKTRHCQDWKKR